LGCIATFFSAKKRHMDDRVCLDLIDICYGAVHRPSEWQRFVDHLTAALDADAGDFVIEDYAGGSADALGSTGFDPTLRLTYDADFLGQNPWLVQLRRLPRLRAFSNDLEPADFERSTYFNEWVRPQGFRHALGGFVEETSTRGFHLGVLRSARRDRFKPQEIRGINRLFPHVRRAIGLSEVVRRAGAQEGVNIRLIDNLRMAAFLLDAAGSVRHMNGPAEDLLRKAHGLCILNSVLTVSDRDAEKALTLAIRNACRIEALAAASGRTEIILQKPDGSGPPLLAAVIPLRGHAVIAESAARCVVLVTDPLEAGNDTPRVLERIWRLTPTELRLALALARGETPSEFAAGTSISVGTARWHLKNLQAKAGVNSLPALVGLVRAIAMSH
jgi:DNA-binding CsgD family transcriptional regulator